MGVVWRATDTTLGRDVAIKVAARGVCERPRAHARFEREAKMLAALNHPRIALDLRSGLGRRRALPRDGAGRGRRPRGAARARSASGGRGARAGATGGRGARGRAREGNHPPRSEAREHQAHPDGQVKVLDFGLAKALEDERTASGSASKTAVADGDRADDRGQRHPRHRRLHESRAGARQEPSDTPRRHLGVRLRALRVPHRPARVRGRNGLRHARQDPRSASPISPRCRAASRRGCASCSSAASPRIHGCGCATSATRIQLDEVLAARSPSGRLIAVEGSTGGTTRDGSPLLGIAAAGVLGLVAGALLWNALGPHRWRRRRRAALPDGRHAGGCRRSVRRAHARRAHAGDAGAAAGRDRRRRACASARVYARPLTGYEFRALPGTEEALGFSTDLDSRGILFVAPVSPGATQRRLAHVPLDGSAPPTTITDWKDSWRSLCRDEQRRHPDP